MGNHFCRRNRAKPRTNRQRTIPRQSIHESRCELIARTRSAAKAATVILLAAPAAVDYYPHLGFRRHDSAWLVSADETLR